MSLLPTGLAITPAIQAALALEPIIIRQRIIGVFVANVTIEERHLDELVITEHPVEQGAAITDHAYKRPSVVTIRAGWSNSSPQADGNQNYVEEIYQGFLLLQQSRIPFEILTGKRAYLNMLIQRLMVTTDESTENVLMMICECKQILIASTQTVTVPNADVMKTPELNAATQNFGTKQLGPAPYFNAGGIGHA